MDTALRRTPSRGLPTTPENGSLLAGLDEDETHACRGNFSRRSSSESSLPFYRERTPTPTGRLAPLADNPLAANPLRRRVESCLLARERTIAQMITWLRSAYRVQEKVGAAYDGGRKGQGVLRSWSTMSASTRDDHRLRAALLIATLRVQTCELVEALDQWRLSRPPLRIVTSSRRELSISRPFVWRGRWWPLQICLDPPLLPLPLPYDPMLLRWFDRAADAQLWCAADGAAPPELFAAANWHPPALLTRMEAAAALLATELETLELVPADLTRQRHDLAGGGAVMGGRHGGSSGSLGGAGRLQMSASVSSLGGSAYDGHASSWVVDGASLQLARLLYGTARVYTSAIRGLCQSLASDAAADDAQRHLAATRLQSMARGRKERASGTLEARRRGRSFQQPLASAGGANAGVGLNKIGLRDEAGGRFAGVACNFSAGSMEGKSVQEGLRQALSSNCSRVVDLFRDCKPQLPNELRPAPRTRTINLPAARSRASAPDRGCEGCSLLPRVRHAVASLRRGPGRQRDHQQARVSSCAAHLGLRRTSRRHRRPL